MASPHTLNLNAKKVRNYYGKFGEKKDLPLWFSHSNSFLKVNLDLFYCFPMITLRLIGGSGQKYYIGIIMS